MLENGECLRSIRRSKSDQLWCLWVQSLYFSNLFESIAKRADLRLQYVRQLYYGC